MGTPDGDENGRARVSEPKGSRLRAVFNVDADPTAEARFSVSRIPPRLAVGVFLALVLFVLYLLYPGVCPL